MKKTIFFILISCLIFLCCSNSSNVYKNKIVYYEVVSVDSVFFKDYYLISLNDLDKNSHSIKYVFSKKFKGINNNNNCFKIGNHYYLNLVENKDELIIKSNTNLEVLIVGDNPIWFKDTVTFKNYFIPNLKGLCME